MLMHWGRSRNPDNRLIKLRFHQTRSHQEFLVCVHEVVSA